MSKFNGTSTNKTVNKCGHVAYVMQDREKLMTQVLSTFYNEKKFYGDNSQEIVETAKRVCEKDPKFVANLAIYARKEFHLRSISHVLTCIVANTVGAKKYTRIVVNNVVERPDDLTEILACYIDMYGKVVNKATGKKTCRPIPNSLKKGLADGMNKFNEFLFSKYNGGSKEIKFKDILQLTHPKPKNEVQKEIFGKILKDELAVATRWETEVSAKGNNEETWESLIEKNQVPYMAALRNLRNIINANPKNIDKVYDKLANRDEVLKSKQLPFRFYSAYKEISEMKNITNKPLEVLETALDYSVENMEKIPGRTAICIDCSSSMSYYSISSDSTIRCNEIASLLGVMATKICDESVIYLFDHAAYRKLISKNASILETTKNICFYGGSTNIAAPIQKMMDDGMKVDRVIILSDNQANCQKGTTQSYMERYREKYDENIWVHSIDLMGYGTQQFYGNKINLIAGWSEKVLNFIMLAEKGTGSLIKTISDYVIKE